MLLRDFVLCVATLNKDLSVLSHDMYDSNPSRMCDISRGATGNVCDLSGCLLERLRVRATSSVIVPPSCVLEFAWIEAQACVGAFKARRVRCDADVLRHHVAVEYVQHLTLSEREQDVFVDLSSLMNLRSLRLSISRCTAVVVTCRPINLEWLKFEIDNGASLIKGQLTARRLMIERQIPNEFTVSEQTEVLSIESQLLTEKSADSLLHAKLSYINPIAGRFDDAQLRQIKRLSPACTVLCDLS